MTRMKVVQNFKAKPVFDSLPALSGFAEEKATLHDAIQGSAALKGAITDAFARFATARKITAEDARLLLLGREPSRQAAHRGLQKTDTTGHSPFEIVARPIGEVIQPIVAKVMEAQG